MSSDEVRRAVQAQRDKLDDTRIKRENAEKLYEQIKGEMPNTAAKMRENGYPLYLRRSFEQKPVRINGKLTDIWLVKIGVEHDRIESRRGFASVAVEAGGPEAGVVFVESKTGETMKIAILMRPRENAQFKVLKERDEFMKLAPVQLNAILQLLKQMQDKPKKLVEDLPWIEPPKTEKEWRQPVKKPQP